jgi:hypothetical protein
LTRLSVAAAGAFRSGKIMDRVRLLDELISFDARINEAISQAVRAPMDDAFEQIIQEIRELRKKRQEIQAKLDATE